MIVNVDWNGKQRPAIVVVYGEKQCECVVFLSSHDEAVYDIGGFLGKSPRVMVDTDKIFIMPSSEAITKNPEDNG